MAITFDDNSQGEGDCAITRECYNKVISIGTTNNKLKIQVTIQKKLIKQYTINFI